MSVAVPLADSAYVITVLPQRAHMCTLAYKGALQRIGCHLGGAHAKTGSHR
jgi:hypothetical protein